MGSFLKDREAQSVGNNGSNLGLGFSEALNIEIIDDYEKTCGYASMGLQFIKQLHVF